MGQQYLGRKLDSGQRTVGRQISKIVIFYIKYEKNALKEASQSRQFLLKHVLIKPTLILHKIIKTRNELVTKNLAISLTRTVN